MENSPAKYAIVYGRTDFHATEGLRTLFVMTLQEVRDMAIHFIKVIPDDPMDYILDVTTWFEAAIKDDASWEDFTIQHQDDDTFLFMVTKVATPTADDIDEFNAFVSDFHPGDDSSDDI